MMPVKLLVCSILILLTHGNLLTGNSQTCTLHCPNNAEPSTIHQQQNTLIRGKAGPRGPKGADGEAGKRGQPGRDCNDLEIDTRITQIESVLNEKIERLKSDLDATKTALTAAKARTAGMERKILLLSTPLNRVNLCGIIAYIDDEMITASSIRLNDPSNYGTHLGRLFSKGGLGGWLGYTMQGEWIQVDLESNHQIYGVATQGASNPYHEWTTTFSVSYKTDGSASFQNIENRSGATLVFQGNTDRNSVVVNNFREPIDARFIRIHPLTYHDWPYIRFDVLTC